MVYIFLILTFMYLFFLCYFWYYCKVPRTTSGCERYRNVLLDYDCDDDYDYQWYDDDDDYYYLALGLDTNVT